MKELMEPDAKVYFANSKGEIKELENKDLLPYGFSKEDL
jgi:cytidine deaminase